MSLLLYRGVRLAALFFTAAVSALASAPVVDPDTIPQSQKPPHPVHVLFYVSDLTTDEQAGAVRQAVGALKTVKDVTVNLDRDYVAVSFDQRDLSFHQIAAAIGESYDPRVLMYVPDYANPQLRPKIQAVFDRPNLTALVRVQPLDAQQGRFFVHFLRLASGIGFN